MVAPLDTVYPNDSMETVMDKFERTKVNYLPVIKSGKYYGFISKANALEAYREKLKAMTIE
jgi:CIC family chloride channel protein